MHKTLFIPGPTEIKEEVLRASSRAMIGHRTKEYQKLQKTCTDGLRWIFDVPDNYQVFVSTSSATGVMEACVRNLVNSRSMHTACGAFSSKWGQIAKQNGKNPEIYDVGFGKGIHPANLRLRLRQEKFDACFLTHCETSTGVMNPLEGIDRVMDDFPDTLLCVDAVSSAAGVPIRISQLKNVDVLLFGLQKCFAGPPGVAFAIVSPRAMDRAKTVENRGHYLDFLTWAKKAEKDQTHVTPPIPQLFSLVKQIERIKEEGLDQRFKRHKEMADTVRSWAKEFFDLFPEEDFYSDTVTCIQNIRELSVAKLNEELALRGKMISNGYGDLKEKTFRIGHMGDHDLNAILDLLSDIEEIWNLKL